MISQRPGGTTEVVKKLVPTALVVLAALASFAGTSRDEREGEETSQAASPDGKFTARVVSDGAHKVTITDRRTTHVDATVDVTNVESVKWTRDSKTIVVVEEIAGGSEAILIHLKGGKWTDTKAPPPTHHEPVKYRVVKEKVGTSNVTLTYRVTEEAANGLNTDTYTCTFSIDPQIGTMTADEHPL